MTVIALHPRSTRLPRSGEAHRGATVEAVILAAGRGSRLSSHTADRPKCLVEIGGTPLLEHQMRMLAMAGVDRISVVAGYRSDDVRDFVGERAEIIENTEWNCTNSLYSLSLLPQAVAGLLLIMNCDVLVHPLALQRLLSAEGSAFLYDSSSGDADEHMKVEMLGGRLTAMSKTLPADRTHGENVGALHFGAEAARLLIGAARDLVADGHGNMWMAAAVERVRRLVPLYGVDIADLPWIEIDFCEDLVRACDQVWRHVAPAMMPPVRLAS